MHLSREIIVDAALSLLSEYGLADTTMRRVAGQLEVAPGALYWHVSNKQELIAALAHRILEPLAGTDAAALALNLRDCVLAYRDGAEVVLAGLSQPGDDAWAGLIERFSATLNNYCADPAVPAAGAQALVHLVLGSAAMEQSRRQLDQAAGGARPEPGAAPADKAATTADAAAVRHGVDIILRGLGHHPPQAQS